MSRAPNFDVTQGAGTTIAAVDVGGLGQLVQASANVAFDDRGWDEYTLVAAGSNNLTQVSSTPTILHQIVVQNVSASVRYIKLFDSLSASVTMGTTSPNMNIGLQGSTTGPSAVFTLDWECATALTFALVTGAALTNNSSVTANDIILNLLYKAQ